MTLGPHDCDGVESHLGDDEDGPVHHGWHSLRVNYPRPMRDALAEAGRTDVHPYFSETGWTSRDLATTADIEACRWLLRLSYCYRASTRCRPSEGGAVLEAIDVAAELDALDPDDRVRGMVGDAVDLEAPVPAAE